MYVCNPLNVDYRYQFYSPQVEGMEQRADKQTAREAADPTMLCFQGKYYIFASMTLSVWISEDMVHWESFRLPENLPLYDYAPDACVIGEYVYFCASSKEHVCDFYRTRDIINGPYEKIPGSFPFWDPKLFADDDGRIYLYWGCSNMTPLYGVELDRETLCPIGKKKELIYGDAITKGYERTGRDHSMPPLSDYETEEQYQKFLLEHGISESQIPEALKAQIYGLCSRKPFIEGAWMTKYRDQYYLQYACPGTEYNIYCDGVYVSASPLGPFYLAKNNPFSYKPGGFLPGAGHGSTMWDLHGNLWHASTMTIGINHMFERRVGVWPAGFDADGELFCNQRYGDWPMSVEQAKMDPWRNPEWYLLSYRKDVTASSYEEKHLPESVTDENIHTWWKAASAENPQWLVMDLGDIYNVHAVQINFADEKISIPIPGKVQGSTQGRYIEESTQCTQWTLEGSMDGCQWMMLEDKSSVKTDLCHDLFVDEQGKRIRFLRLTILKVPYCQKPCVSGLRVFGYGNGQKPDVPEFSAIRTGDMDMEVTMRADNTIGYNILWGHKPEKLYHSCMVFQKVKDKGEKKQIGALVRGITYYLRVDAFNENGITEGKVTLLCEK